MLEVHLYGRVKQDATDLIQFPFSVTCAKEYLCVKPYCSLDVCPNIDSEIAEYFTRSVTTRFRKLSGKSHNQLSDVIGSDPSAVLRMYGWKGDWRGSRELKRYMSAIVAGFGRIYVEGRPAFSRSDDYT
jgi:hypothetical protein